MRTLSASELLEVWERGRVQGSLEQSLLLLASACPETSTDELACLSIGLRDHALLTLRDWTFGHDIDSVAECPQCGERLELAFDTSSLQHESGVVGAEVEVRPASESFFSLDADGYALRFRCANSQDLIVISDALQTHHDPGQQQGRRMLLERCVLKAECNGKPVPVRTLPDNILDALERGMAQADPHADLHLAVSCPACHHQWQPVFDIVSYFWSEIDTWAKRMLHEVHVLARAYGWREQDILSLSPLRRQCYLDMVGA